MRVLLPCGLLLALLLASGACMGQTVIHHCIAANGTPVFTDQPCASLGAIPFKAQHNPLTPGTARGARHCPLTLKALKQRIKHAVRQRNANALAGLMLWRGYGARGATHAIQQLAQLMREPFLGFAQPPPTPAPATSTKLIPLLPPMPSPQPAKPAPAQQLTLTFADPAQPHVTFQITRHDGCFWLQP